MVVAVVAVVVVVVVLVVAYTSITCRSLSTTDIQHSHLHLDGVGGESGHDLLAGGPRPDQETDWSI